MMADYVDQDGVRTWYAEYGSGPPVVLAHPGGVGVDSRAFGPNVEALAASFHVFTPDRRGHGRTPDVDGQISYDAMARDTIAFLEQVVGAPAHVVGYSDGSVVALLVALHRPDLVRRLVFVAGVFHRDGWIPGVLEADPQAPEVPAFLAASYAEVSPDGAEHGTVVAAKLARMHASEPTLTVADLAKIRTPTLVMFGDDDEVTMEHVIDLYHGLPAAELAVVPGTSHGLLMEKPELCNTLIIDFLSNEPVPTLAPIRRAAP
jgi:pimeloyl-ACP methyl ester carboxylesterase